MTTSQELQFEVGQGHGEVGCATNVKPAVETNRKWAQATQKCHVKSPLNSPSDVRFPLQLEALTAHRLVRGMKICRGICDAFSTTPGIRNPPA